MQKFELHVIWQTGRNPVDIIFLRVTALWFQEQLMRTPIGKFDHFVLDRGAVPRACAFDSAGVKRRPVEIGPNDLVRAGSRLSDPARHLFHVELPIAVVIQRKEII